MMSFNLSGTTNFKTEKVNMTVHAAPGKHETDGVMPLTLKIGGTVRAVGQYERAGIYDFLGNARGNEQFCLARREERRRRFLRFV